jgi:fucose permease
LIVGLFFLWGVANKSAFYLGYFLLALPAAVLMRRYGYKQAVVGIAMLVPAACFAAIACFGLTERSTQAPTLT